MTERFSRRTIACALLATTSLCGLVAGPAAAQAYQPQKFRQLDANGVDVTWGDYAMDFVEGSIGSGQAKLELVRNAQYRPGAYDGNSNNLNWDRIWLSYTYSSFSGTHINVNIGSHYEAFTSTGTLPSGSTLSGGGGSYTYTTADGTVIEFQDPTESTASNSNLCNGTQTQCILLPVSITSPDGRSVGIGWDVHAYYLTSGGPVGGGGGITECQVDDPDCVPGGNGTTTVSYDTRIAQVTNSFGYRIAFTYASNTGGVGAPSAEDWHKRTRADFYNESRAPGIVQSTISYAYPSAGVTQVTDTGGRIWRFTGTGDRVTGIRRPGAASDTTTVSYNGTTALVSSVTREGVTTSYSRSVSGSTATMIVTDALAHQKVITSDLNVGRPTSVTDELNHTTAYQYDGSGNLTQVTQPEGNYTHYTYDGRGNVTEVRRVAKSGSGVGDIVTSAGYDLTCSNPVTCNEPNTTTDAKGNITNYAYDPTHGGVLTITRPAPTAGSVRPQTRFIYTAAAPYLLAEIRQCQTQLGELNGAAAVCKNGSDEVKTTVAYDSYGNGNLTCITKGNGSGTLIAPTAMTYDAVGNLTSVDGPLASADTTTFRYNSARELTGVTAPDPDGAGPLKLRAVRNTYANGLLTKQELGTVNSQLDSDWAGFAPARAVDFGFDGNARNISTSVSSGGTTYSYLNRSYDALGRPDCIAVRMNPDAYSSLPGACSLSTLGAYGSDRITKLIYDNASNVTKVQVGVGTSDAADERTLTYTNNGQLASLLDGENNLTAYVYDDQDRPLKSVYSNPTKGAASTNGSDYEQVSYDANSNVTEFRTRSGALIDFGYDSLDRQTSLTSAAVPGRVYTYDLLDRPLTATFASNGQGITNSYDALDRLTSSATNVGGTSRAMAYQYDLAGRRTKTIWWDGVYVDDDRLVTGELSKVRLNGAISGLGVLATFAYDDLGRRTSLTRGNGTVTSYSYDAVSRLTSLTHDLAGTANDLTITNSYNPASQIVGQARSNDTYAWTGAVNAARPYTSNGLNQYTAAGSATFAYDGNGNLTSDGTSSFTYDAENKLTSVTAGGTTKTLAYDPLDRLDTYNPGTASRFIYDGDEVAAVIDSTGAIERRYVRGDGADELIFQLVGSIDRWYYGDERGSVVTQTDDAGNAQIINRYDEYGLPQSTNSGYYQYTGQMWLSEIGVYNYKARAYSPTAGRFLQTDPIGPVDSPNLYQYALNDPANVIDPLGLTCNDIPVIPGSGSIYVTARCPRDEGAGFRGFAFGGGGGGFFTGRRFYPNMPSDDGGGSSDASPPAPPAEPTPQCGPNPEYSSTDAARDVGNVVADLGAALEIGGLVAAAALPPVGGAVATVGALTNLAGTLLVGYADYSEGRFGALAVDGISAAAGAGAFAGAKRLGSGAWRASSGRFATNPFGGGFRDAKAKTIQFVADKVVSHGGDAVRCAK